MNAGIVIDDINEEPSREALPAHPPPSYARVYLIDAPFHIDRPYNYFIPEQMRGSVREGVFVVVPFGGGNRRQIALVEKLLDEDYFENSEYKFKDKIKPILSLLYEGLTLDAELLELCLYMREHTFCTVGDAARTILPSAAFGKINEYYTVSADTEPPLPGKCDDGLLILYGYIKKQKKVTLSRVRLDLGEDAAKRLPELEENGYIKSSLEYKESGGRLFSERVSLAVSAEKAREFINADSGRRNLRQCAVAKLLLDGPLTSDELKKKLGDVRLQLRALSQKGIISVERTELFRDPYSERTGAAAPDDNILSESQKAAFERIYADYRTGEPKAALLHGITGSGKTRVIKAIADRVIADGRKVIMMVPEIALTPQTVDYFRSCYGERTAVIHSSLSAGERLDMWRRIKQGEIDICIGTRSAVFAPFKNIGMIVLDEEQEHTYKSDMDPKYHARDIARFRCARHSALMLLSSATPSVESYYKAETGVYSLVELTERYGESRLPEVIVADIREQAKETGIIAYGSLLRKEIKKNLDRGEQTILFLNRRGYNNFICCPCCGTVIMCPRCSVSLTYHVFSLAEEKGGKGGYLSCHYCGYRQAPPRECPSCKNKNIQFLGIGTQKAQEELALLFPEAKIIRMDADTTSTKFAYQELIGDFRARKADIMIGTQMVTKGHDFPGVTLSAVINADAALYLDDYRANERTFAMVCQLLGRSGRVNAEGRAVIQTYNPENPIIKLAAAQDYKSFYKNEIAMRRALLFPPFCDIALITLISDSEKDMANAAAALGDYIKTLLAEQYTDVAVQVFGPFEAPIYKVNEKFRMRVVIKCRLNKRTRMFLRRVTAEFCDRLYKKFTVTIDINPNSL